MSIFLFLRKFMVPQLQIQYYGKKTEKFLEFYAGRIGPWSSSINLFLDSPTKRLKLSTILVAFLYREIQQICWKIRKQVL